MKRLTKMALAKELVDAQNLSRYDMLTQSWAVDIIETLADLIVCHFVEGGESVTIRGFGTLKIVHRKSFVGTNPRTGHALRISARKSLSFKPGGEVTKRINYK